MAHYFTNDYDNQNVKEIEYFIHNETLKFKTDNNVFSKSQVDFGSDLLIRTVIEDSQVETKDFIDMGAGYGPIGIVIAKFKNITPYMIDVNERALALAKDNAKLSNINGRFMNREMYDQMDIQTSLYVTNPPFRTGKNIVLSIINDAHHRLNDGGEFYMVVQKKQGMPSYKKKIDETFNNVEVVQKDKGYYILKAFK